MPPVVVSRPIRAISVAVAGIVWTVFAILSWTSSFGPLGGRPGGIAAALLVTAVPGILILRASRRSDLLTGLRQALALLAFSMLLTAAGNFLRFIHALGIALPVVPGLDLTTTFVIWALGLAALIRIPLTPLDRGKFWQVIVDITIAVVGMTLAIYFIWTMPGMRLAPPAVHRQVLIYDSMEAANLVVLNLILVRGPRRPIRRAIGLLAATIVIETIYLISVEYALGRHSHDFRLGNSLFFIDYIAYLYVGAFFLGDKQPETDVALLPEGVRVVNPLPLAAVLGVGVLLLVSAVQGSAVVSLPLAIGIVVMALLLLARVIGTSLDNLWLMREEAARERARHGEKVEMLGRLSGGIAHVINNLMTVVLGHAELARSSAGGDSRSRQNLDAISSAADRASALAARLMFASGRRRVGDRQRRRIGELLAGQRESMALLPSSPRELDWDLGDGPGEALLTAEELEVILRELLSNAADAMPDGGTITVRLRDETLSELPPGLSPPPRPGRYSILEVADSGRGIAREALPRLFEPFFTTRPIHEGRGLGLSVIHGIVTSNAGGVLVDSVPGGGTRVRIYLPAGP